MDEDRPPPEMSLLTMVAISVAIGLVLYAAGYLLLNHALQ